MMVRSLPEEGAEGGGGGTPVAMAGVLVTTRLRPAALKRADAAAGVLIAAVIAVMAEATMEAEATRKVALMRTLPGVIATVASVVGSPAASAITLRIARCVSGSA